MLSVGQKAPDFQLTGVHRGEADVYDLHRVVGESVALLLFYPADFVPPCTAELRAVSEAGWHEVEELTVWGLSGDSLFAHAAYAEREGIDFPLLSDFHAGVADSYGVCADDWHGHYDIPARATFLVDRDWTVRCAHRASDAFESDGTVLAEVGKELDPLLDADLPPAGVE